MQTPHDAIYFDTVDPGLVLRRRVLARAFAVLERLEIGEGKIDGARESSEHVQEGTDRAEQAF